MDKAETVGNVALYSGGLTACTAAVPAYDLESMTLLIISMTGALVSVLGLVWTVYHGNRQYKLALAQLEAERIKNEAFRHVEVVPTPGE